MRNHHFFLLLPKPNRERTVLNRIIIWFFNIWLHRLTNRQQPVKQWFPTINRPDMNNLPPVVTTHSFVVIAVFHYKEEESSRGRSKIARCDQDPLSRWSLHRLTGPRYTLRTDRPPPPCSCAPGSCRPRTSESRDAGWRWLAGSRSTWTGTRQSDLRGGSGSHIGRRTAWGQGGGGGCDRETPGGCWAWSDPRCPGGWRRRREGSSLRRWTSWSSASLHSNQRFTDLHIQMTNNKRETLKEILYCMLVCFRY